MYSFFLPFGAIGFSYCPILVPKVRKRIENNSPCIEKFICSDDETKKEEAGSADSASRETYLKILLQAYLAANFLASFFSCLFIRS